MRTIEVTLDGKRCCINLNSIRAFFEDARQDSQLIVIAIEGLDQMMFTDESLDSFSQRYEAAMDEMECVPTGPPEIKVINLSNDQSICPKCLMVYLAQFGHTCAT